MPGMSKMVLRDGDAGPNLLYWVQAGIPTRIVLDDPISGYDSVRTEFSEAGHSGQDPL
jgi:hypothetical protein